MFRFVVVLCLSLASLLVSNSLTGSVMAASPPAGWTNPWITDFTVAPTQGGAPGSITMSGHVTNWANLGQLTVNITGVAGNLTTSVNPDGSFSTMTTVAAGTTGNVTAQATAGGTNNSNPMTDQLF